MALQRTGRKRRKGGEGMNSLLYLFDRIKDLYLGENYNKDVVDFTNMFVKPLIKIDCIIKRDIADEFYNETSGECPNCAGKLVCFVSDIDYDGICLNITCSECGTSVCMDIKYIYDNMFENAMKGIGGDEAYLNLSNLIHNLIKDSLEEFNKEEGE